MNYKNTKSKRETRHTNRTERAHSMMLSLVFNCWLILNMLSERWESLACSVPDLVSHGHTQLHRCLFVLSLKIHSYNYTNDMYLHYNHGPLCVSIAAHCKRLLPLFLWPIAATFGTWIWGLSFFSTLRFMCKCEWSLECWYLNAVVVDISWNALICGFVLSQICEEFFFYCLNRFQCEI